MGENFEAGAYGAALGIVAPIDQTGDARLDDGPGTHGAGFDGDVEGDASEAVVIEDTGSLPQDHDFGVGSGVAIADGAVTGAGQDVAPMDKHSANGHFSGRGRCASLLQCRSHELDVNFHRRKRITWTEKRLRVRLTIARPHQKLTDMGGLLTRLSQWDILKGLAVTFRYQHPKNIYTEQYPLERPMVAERYRGAPRLNKHPETGETLCIACNLCALACPENLIVVGWERDDATRRKVLTTFTYDTSRCMFCGLCEDACPTDCLELTQDFEMAYYSREGAIWDRHRLEEGPTPARYTR